MRSWYVTGLYGGGIGFLGGVALMATHEFLPVSWLLLAIASVIGAGLYRLYKKNWFWLLGIVCICIALGGFRASQVLPIEKPLPNVVEANKEITVEGVVTKDPELRADSQHLQVTAFSTELLAVVDRHYDVSYGDKVRLTGLLSQPEPFAAELGRVFAYDGYLAAKGVSYTMFYPEVKVLETGLGNPFISTLFTIKHIFRNQLEQVLPEPQSALATGLLLGERRALSETKLEEFRSTGIIHIVVLSGMSVMFVVSFVQYVLGLFLSLRLRIVFSLLAVLAFAIMVGLSATVVRASIMASMFLLAQFMGRSYLALRGLIVSAVLMVAINPVMLVYDIGFQLSFMATLGLVLVAPHLEQMMASVPNRIPVKTYFIATVATQIAVLPLLLYQVGEFSIVSPVVNMLVVPMVPVAMLLSFVTALLGVVFPPVASVVAIITYFSLDYILLLSHWFDEFYFTSFWVPAFPIALLAVSYAILTAGYFWIRSRIYTKSVKPVKLKDLSSVSQWKILDIEDFLSSYSDSNQDKKTSPTPEGVGEEKSSVPVFFR